MHIVQVICVGALLACTTARKKLFAKFSIENHSIQWIQATLTLTLFYHDLEPQRDVDSE